MKTCANCNLTYTDDKKFCLKCGKPLTMIHQIEPKEVAKKNVFEDRLKSDPLNIEILHEYAQFLFNNLLFSDANTVLLKILAIKDNDGIAKELLFKSYFNLNLFKEASEIGKQLLSEKPTDIFLLQELAEISGKMGDSEKVTEYYNKILRLQPSHSAALYNKAQNLLAENQFEKSIEIFKNLHSVGKTDRITVIYAGIDKALNNDYKTAINLLSPILGDETFDANDTNTNRGILYLSFSLCKTSADLTEIKRWAEKINFKNLKKNQHPLDVQTNLKIAEFVVIQSLNEINQSSDANNKISELTKSYLIDSYFTENCNSKIANLWYAVGNKQFELKLLEAAIVSFQKVVGLCPHESKYQQKLTQIEKTVEDAKQAKSRRTKKVIFALLVVLTIITVSVFIYRNYAESKAWELTNKTNTLESVQNYLSLYPNGKFVKEAKQTLEKYGVVDIDGNVYHTITIGKQVWMVENLKVTHFRNGDPIPNVSGKSEWEKLYSKSGAYCNYNNDASIAAIYGRLYNWTVITDPRNVAPKGWHIPTDTEWETLVNFMGGIEVAGGKLKKIGTSNWQSPNTGATNINGFSALPSGTRYFNGSFSYLGEFGYLYSSAGNQVCFDYDKNKVRYQRPDFSISENMNFGNSVRCIKD